MSKLNNILHSFFFQKGNLNWQTWTWDNYVENSAYLSLRTKQNFIYIYNRVKQLLEIWSTFNDATRMFIYFINYVPKYYCLPNEEIL